MIRGQARQPDKRARRTALSSNQVEQSITISTTLNRTNTMQGVINAIGELSLKLTGADRDIVLVFEDDTPMKSHWSAGLSETFITAIEKAIETANEQPDHLIKPANSAHLIADIQAITDQDFGGKAVFLQEGIRSTGFWSLLYEGKNIATIGCFFDQPHDWTSAEQDGMQLLSRLATTPIENALLFESMQHQVEETVSLYRALTPLFNPQAGTQALAQQIVDTVFEEFSWANCAILLYDENVDGLVTVAQGGYDEKVASPLPLDGKGLTVAAYNQNEIIYVPDVSLDDRYIAYSPMTRCELVLPLRTSSRVLGVINVESQFINAFDEASRQILTSYAGRAALALENAQLFEIMGKHASQTKFLNEITNSALQASDLESLLRSIADMIGELLEADGSYICFRNENGILIQCSGNYGPGHDKNITRPLASKGNRLTMAVISQGKTLVIDNFQQSIYFDPEAAFPDKAASLIGLPLNADNLTLGMVMIGFLSPHHFSLEEITLGEQAAGQAALALSKMKSLELAHRRAWESENLRSATAALTSSLDINQVLRDILNHLEQVVHHDSACIFLRHGDHLSADAGKGISSADGILGNSFPVDNPFFMEISSTHRALVLEDAQMDRRLHILGKTSRTRGWMGIPLITGGNIIGVLTLESLRTGTFGPDQALMAQAFANQAAAALQNARLFEEEQQRSNELAALNRATAALESTLDSQELLKRILDAASSAVPSANRGRLVMFDPETGGLQVQASFGYPEANRPEGSYPEHGIHIINTIRQRRAAILFPDGTQGGSAIVAPLLVDPQVFGAISLESPSQPAFKDTDLNLLVSFGSTATAAIRNAMLYAEVQKLAITDPLTGLYNRRGFFDLGLREYERSTRYTHLLGCIMIDADLLKQVNDSCGHAIGDQLLMSIADQCRINLRKTDIIGRYGGDEFAILLPETDLAAAKEIAVRLRDSISEKKIECDGTTINQSISLGIAIFNQDCQSLDMLLSRADRALYHSKQVGRNCLSVWEPGMPAIQA